MSQFITYLDYWSNTCISQYICTLLYIIIIIIVLINFKNILTLLCYDINVL